MRRYEPGFRVSDKSEYLIIDQDALTALISVIAQVKRCGGNDPGSSVWHHAALNMCVFPQDIPLPRISKSDTYCMYRNGEGPGNTFKSAKDRVHALRNATCVLMGSAERAFGAMLDREEISAYGIPSKFNYLPNELLERIFRTAVISHRKDYEKHVLVATGHLDCVRIDPGPEVSLSQVCRHFRQVALGFPDLWSHVSNSMTPKSIKLRLARSKPCQLQVGLHVDDHEERYRPSKINNFMDSVIPSRNRWRHFQATIQHMHQAPYGYVLLDQTLRSNHFAMINLPSLKSLKILTLNDMTWCRLHFYKYWKMPKLAHLSTSHHVPEVEMKLKSLKSYQFAFDSQGREPDGTYDPFQAQPLDACLSKLSNLTDLTIEILFRIQFSAGSLIQLPKVNSFTIRVSNPKVLEYCTNFDLPMLKIFKIHITDRDQVQPTSAYDWIRHLTEQCIYDGVEELMIKVFNDYIQDSMYAHAPLTPLWSIFPHLKRLTINSPYWVPSCVDYNEEPSIPLSLVNLRLLNVPDVANVGFKELMKGLEIAGNWRNFKLEIRTRRQPALNWVKKVFPGATSVVRVGGGKLVDRKTLADENLWLHFIRTSEEEFLHQHGLNDDDGDDDDDDDEHNHGHGHGHIHGHDDIPRFGVSQEFHDAFGPGGYGPPGPNGLIPLIPPAHLLASLNSR